MQIIDCDGYFGFRASGGDDTSLETLLRHERAQGISYVMACSVKARTYDSREGNDDTLRAAREHEELLPVASVDPRTSQHIESEIARAAGLGFVAVRVFPEFQGWPVDSVLFSRIVDACDEYKMPLLITARAAGSASQVVRRAQHTSNPIVLLGADYATQAEALSAAASRPNTLVCTTRFITPGVVELAARTVGVDNLVLGTSSPDLCIRPAINMILASELSESDKEKILGGNMGRIIGDQVRKLNVTLSRTWDRGAYEAKRFTQPMIDVHAHNGPWPFPMDDPDCKYLSDLMRRRGVSKTVVSSTKAIVNDFVEGNAELAKGLEDCDNLYGYVTINPNYVEKSIEQVETYLKNPKFVGVKLHPAYTRASIDGEANKKIVAAFADQKVPMLIHTWGAGEPTKVQRLAQQFPDVPFIMGHGGADGWREAADVINNTTNTYTEFSNSSVEPTRVSGVLDKVDYKRVLLGTDAGLFDPAFDMGIYEEADLNAEQRAAILWDNAARIFRF